MPAENRQAIETTAMGLSPPILNLLQASPGLQQVVRGLSQICPQLLIVAHAVRPPSELAILSRTSNSSSSEAA